MASKKKKLPAKKVLKFDVEPDRGFASMAASLRAPKGYAFSSMKREGTEASITYVRIKP